MSEAPPGPPTGLGDVDAPDRAAGDPLGLRFTDCEHGWIMFVVPALGARPIACTHIVDPFSGMVAWLEAIVRGDTTACWDIAEEGSSARLIYVDTGPSYLGGGPERIVLLHDAGVLFGFATARVARRALVREFYTVFRAFTGSSDYRPDHWEPALSARELPHFLTTQWLNEEDGRTAWHTLGDVEAPGWDGEYLALLRSPAVEAYLRDDPSRQAALPLE